MNPGKAYEKQYFLFLLPVFFLLHGITENYALVPISTCFLLLLKYLLVTAILTVLAFLVIRSWRTAGMFAFFVMGFHFFFGAVHDTLKDWFAGLFIVKYSFILPAVLVALIVLIIYLKRKKPDFLKLSRYLNFLFGLLILIEIVRLGTKAAEHPEKAKKDYSSFVACDSCDKPDIFLIIADEYAGKKELTDIFHFDNSPFENELKKRGFYIVDSSHSNYNFTPFSMASMLGMNYLEKLEGRNQSINDRNICYRAIDQNLLLNFLEMQGYDVINCSIFQVDGKRPDAFTPYYKTGADLITAHTFLSRLNRDIRFNLVTRFKIRSEVDRMLKLELRLNETLYQKTWDEVSKTSDKPRFVYTHLEMPHYPYYFDRDGKPRFMRDLNDVQLADKGQYIEYLLYANKKYLQLIDHIFTQAKKPPVVIFMSDHGFREFFPDTVDHAYHFMNINSIHLPGKQYEGFYKGMSNVNQFRVLLNTQFRQHLPLLKDSTSFLKE